METSYHLFILVLLLSKELRMDIMEQCVHWYLSGELAHQTKGMANAYSVNGKSLGKINVTDPRWKTGELYTKKQK